MCNNSQTPCESIAGHSYRNAAWSERGSTVVHSGAWFTTDVGQSHPCYVIDLISVNF